jgi:hypothetical protein
MSGQLDGKTQGYAWKTTFHFLARASAQLFPDWLVVVWSKYPRLFIIVILNYLKWQNMARERSRAARETLNPTISSVLVRSAMFSFTCNIDGAGCVTSMELTEVFNLSNIH